MARKRTFKVYDSPEIYFEPRGDGQREALDVYKNNDITFLLGPAGCGKSHIAVYCALYDMFARIQTRRVDKVIITRPLVEAGENLGFLPGEIDEKVHPYMLPIYDCVGKTVHRPEEIIKTCFQISPLAYLRGVTFDNCTAILDEAQNCTNVQLKLFLTRLGQDAKIIIAGDTEQSDIGKLACLKRVVESLEGTEGIGVYRFTDAQIVRHPLIEKILKRWPK